MYMLTNKKLENKIRFLQIGFVALFLVTIGVLLFVLMRPADGTEIKATVGYPTDGMVDTLYPVNSIYISTDSINPGDKFGGTWVVYGSGRTLVGVNAGDVEFSTVGKTGGAKTHTLTVAEMPSQNHTAYYATGYATGGTSNALFYIPVPTQPAPNVIANTGGSGAHNNVQPYITVYFWKRTN
jgi:hypothetical protein